MIRIGPRGGRTSRPATGAATKRAGSVEQHHQAGLLHRETGVPRQVEDEEGQDHRARLVDQGRREEDPELPRGRPGRGPSKGLARSHHLERIVSRRSTGKRRRVF